MIYQNPNRKGTNDTKRLQGITVATQERHEQTRILNRRWGSTAFGQYGTITDYAQKGCECTYVTSDMAICQLSCVLEWSLIMICKQYYRTRGVARDNRRSPWKSSPLGTPHVVTLRTGRKGMEKSLHYPSPSLMDANVYPAKIGMHSHATIYQDWQKGRAVEKYAWDDKGVGFFRNVMTGERSNQILQQTIVLNIFVACTKWPGSLRSDTTRNKYTQTLAIPPPPSPDTDGCDLGSNISLTNSQRDTTVAHRRKTSKIQILDPFAYFLGDKQEWRITKFGTASNKDAGGKHSNNGIETRRNADEKEFRVKSWRT